jgi:hypothetical protein
MTAILFRMTDQEFESLPSGVIPHRGREVGVLPAPRTPGTVDGTDGRVHR